jgi:hypothetical protein
MARSGRGKAAWQGFLLGFAAGTGLGVWLASAGRARAAAWAHAGLDALEGRVQRAVARGRAWIWPQPVARFAQEPGSAATRPSEAEQSK